MEKIENTEIKDYSEYTKNIAFYKLLSEEEKRLVNSNVSVKKFSKNEMIHSCTVPVLD